MGWNHQPEMDVFARKSGRIIEILIRANSQRRYEWWTSRGIDTSKNNRMSTSFGVSGMVLRYFRTSLLSNWFLLGWYAFEKEIIANLNHEQTTSWTPVRRWKQLTYWATWSWNLSGGSGGLQRKITNTWTEYLKNHGVKPQLLGSLRGWTKNNPKKAWGVLLPDDKWMTSDDSHSGRSHTPSNKISSNRGTSHAGRFSTLMTSASNLFSVSWSRW